jgi:energy-coupling factor transporter transmembrane protein EcfT
MYVLTILTLICSTSISATLFSLSLLLVIIFIPISIIFFIKKKEFNIALVILTIISMLLIVSILLASISSYIDIIYNTIYDYAYYEQEYYFDYYSIMDCELVFILSDIMLDLTILTFIFNLISMKKRKNQTTQMQNSNVNIIETKKETIENKNSDIDNTNTTNTVNSNSTNTKPLTNANMAKELKDIKQMYDNKIISEEEYNKIRSLIIAKYYK